MSTVADAVHMTLFASGKRPRVRNWRLNLAGRPDIRKILILKWSAMGDIVIATAAINDIANAFPDAEIHLSTSPPWQRLFESDDRFSAVRVFDFRGKDRGAKGLLRFARQARDEAYDAVFDFQSNDHSRLAVLAMRLTGKGPGYRVGFHRRFPYNVAAEPPLPPVHAGTYASALLEAAGIPSRTSRPVLRVDDALSDRVEERLEGLGLNAGEYAVMLPGCQAAGYLKRWGANRYASLAQRLLRDEVSRVVLLGGPDEVEECEAIARAGGHGILNLCGQTELLELLPICERARYIVANDTGTAHLASATGRPMVVICGPTDPRRVLPLGDNVAACQANLACINCYRKHCEHHSCMALVTPSEVHQRLESLVRRSSCS